MLFLILLSRLPLGVLYILSDFFFVVSYYLIGYRSKVIMKNLRNSFPEKGEKEIRHIQKQFYRNLCDYGTESLKLRTMSEKEIKRRMKFTNPEAIQKMADEKQSVIYLVGHQFNWEWLLAVTALSLPLPVDFVYQPQGSKLFDKFSLDTRTRFGYPVKRNDVAREALKRKNVLRGIGIVCDQFPGHDQDKKFWTTFLNQETAFFAGIDQLAYLTQYPAFFMAMHKLKRGYYEIEVVPLATPPYSKESTVVVENFAAEAERLIKKYPAGWLWSHNRWKKKKSDYAKEITGEHHF